MTTPSFDVAVVGAGPAGLTAARTLSDNGISTVVLDRRKIVGLPIQCGEFLPTPTEIADLFPNSPRAPRLVDVPSKLILNQTKSIRLLSPKNRPYEFNLRSNIIDRARFDQHLAELASKAGAEIWLNSRVTKLARNNVVTYTSNGLEKRVKVKVVIGADGPRSIVAKSIGIQYPDLARDFSASVQYVMSGTNFDSDVTQMFFGNLAAPGGYMWVIPKNDSRANVGYGLRYSHLSSRVSLTKFLDRFIRTNPVLSEGTKNAKIESRIGASIPVGGPLHRTYTNNVLLVGDAAGHVMASNGGGVCTALVGGEIAGNSIIKHLRENKPLSIYETMWKQEIGQELASSLGVLRVADWVMKSDALTEVGMRLTTTKYLEDVIRCRFPQPFSFASRPLAYLLKYLR
ncbi:MAG: geranylgeranyl reductase family protein [Candidatus Thorarchaeota archaeon]